MFQTREHFGLNNIELAVLAVSAKTREHLSPQQSQQSQIIDQSQVFNETNDEKQAKYDVVDEEEEQDEILVDYMVNDEYVFHEQEPLPTSHVYCPPKHMTNLNLGEEEPFSHIFYNSYMQTNGA